MNEAPGHRHHAMEPSSQWSGPLGRFRAVALAEGVSYLLLFAVTMPLKYFAAMPEPNRVVGMTHGVLSVLYVVLLVVVARHERWSLLRSAVALVASLLPFGAFVLEAWLRRQAPQAHDRPTT
jgi:integral membrane protein